MVKIEYATLEPQIKWEIAKFKIREFSIAFSKKIAKDKREKLAQIENVIKSYENSSMPTVSQDLYEQNKSQFELIMNEKTNGHNFKVENGKLSVW